LQEGSETATILYQTPKEREKRKVLLNLFIISCEQDGKRARLHFETFFRSREGEDKKSSITLISPIGGEREGKKSASKSLSQDTFVRLHLPDHEKREETKKREDFHSFHFSFHRGRKRSR